MQLLTENIDAIDGYIDGSVFYRALYGLKNKLRLNTNTRSPKYTQMHYDLGNDFYKLWLDKTLTYSGALFNGNAAKSLEEAQRAKYRRILDHLSPWSGDHILELGCGWGGFMEEAAKRGYRVTGTTLSETQAELARERLAKAGLGHLTEVRLQDYRAVAEQFDHVVSIGMFEHVGEEFWPGYMKKVQGALKPAGRAMIQSIVVRDDRFNRYRSSSDFMREHIFPGGMLPSPSRFKRAAGRAGLKVCDTFFFGGDYAITLGKWLENFDARLPEIRELGYDDAFIRKWRVYLTGSAAMFRTGRINLMQAELRQAG
jgi:cyclopropane-fatty-acyl-phospholipid synthase